MKNKFKWSLLAIIALIATVAMAADKFISSSGNIVLKTATSKSVNLQDTLYTTQARKVGIGTGTPSNLLNVKAEDGVSDNDYVSVIENAEATSGRNFGLHVKGGSTVDDVSFQASNKSGTSLLSVRGNGNVLLGNTTKKFQSLTGYYGLPDNVYTPIIAVGSYFTMRLIVMCYGDSSRSASSIFDFSSHTGVPSTYTQTGVKYNNVSSMLVRVNGNNVELLADTVSGSGMNCYYNAQGIDNTDLWGSY